MEVVKIYHVKFEAIPSKHGQEKENTWQNLTLFFDPVALPFEFFFLELPTQGLTTTDRSTKFEKDPIQILGEIAWTPDITWHQ